MRRRLFNSFCAVSLLSCMAACGLWVRSYWRDDWVIKERRTHYMAYSSRASLFFQRAWTADEKDPSGVEGGQPIWFGSAAASEFLRQYFDKPRFMGFGVTRHVTWVPARVGVSDNADRVMTLKMWQADALIVPSWFSATLFAILPLAWLRRWRRLRSAANAGRCPGCGYDLRATPDRCPECGREAKK